MPIEYAGAKARLSGVVGVEEAEGLLDWIAAHPKGRIDLASCEHLHAANLQVLMACRVRISAWPRETGLGNWLKGALRAH